MDAATSATESAASRASKAGASKQKLAEDLDQFMHLLVTQLKHQDPLDPMDPNEFTSQLVQFASVEQQIQGNQNLEDMLEFQKSSLLGTVVSYIGKQIEVSGTKIPLENGLGRGSYELPAASERTVISITDKNGGLVFEANGEQTAGKHLFVWDGTHFATGRPVPDGTYNVSVEAKGTDGKDLEVKHTVIGTVNGVSSEKGVSSLWVGKSEFHLDDIISVREPLPPRVDVVSESEPATEETPETSEASETETETGPESDTESGTESEADNADEAETADGNTDGAEAATETPAPTEAVTDAETATEAATETATEAATGTTEEAEES